MKTKELTKLSKTERENKLKELKLEMIKATANTAKGGTSKIKEIRKMIARILTFSTKERDVLKKK